MRYKTKLFRNHWTIWTTCTCMCKFGVMYDVWLDIKKNRYFVLIIVWNTIWLPEEENCFWLGDKWGNHLFILKWFSFWFDIQYRHQREVGICNSLWLQVTDFFFFFFQKLLRNWNDHYSGYNSFWLTEMWKCFVLHFFQNSNFQIEGKK